MSFKNKFGWSVSRESLFGECRRRYYFHYYFSWGGWEAGAPTLIREAFKLKRLTSLALWRGQLVHYVASKVLQSMQRKGRIPDKEKVADYTLERFRNQLDFSEAKRYRTEPKKRGGRLNIDWLALLEHEYGRTLDTERLDRTKNECVEGVEGIFKSPILAIISKSDTSSWVIEDLDKAEFSQSFEFEGVTVYAKTDFMFRGFDGTFNIVDWKTNRGAAAADGDESQGRNARVQLGIYGFYAVHVLGETLDSLRLYEVNLLRGGSVTEHAIDEGALEAFEGHIRSGIEKLAAALVDSDINKNEALSPEAFPKIDNGSCRFCNFYRICKDESYPDRLL